MVIKTQTKNYNGLQMNMQNVSGMLLKLLGMIIAVTLPIRPQLIAVGVLIFADLFTGVWASVKEGKPITSNGLRRTVNMVVGYELAVLAAFLLETYLLDGMPVLKVATGLIGVTEGKSFFENIKRITGVDFSTAILSKLNLQDIKNTPPDEK